MNLCKFCNNWHNLIIDFYQTREESKKEIDNCECECHKKEKENEK